MRLIAVMPAPIRLHSVIELPAVPRCGEPGAVRRLLARGRLRLSRYPKLKHNMNINLCNVSKKEPRWPRSDLRTACQSASWRNVPGYRPRLAQPWRQVWFSARAAVGRGRRRHLRSRRLRCGNYAPFGPMISGRVWRVPHAVRAQPGNVSRSTGKDPHSLSGQTLTAVTQQYPLGRMPSGDQAGSGGLGADPAGGPWPFVLAAAAGLLLALAGGCGGSSTRCPVRPATEKSAVGSRSAGLASPSAHDQAAAGQKDKCCDLLGLH